MTETIEYEQFDGSASTNGAASEHASPSDLSRLNEIPMELSVEIGRTHMTVGETLDLRVGSVVALERLAGETADLLVNGSAIARGEVVVIDEQYGLRITEILDGQNDISPEDEQPIVAAAPAELEPPSTSAPGIAASSAGGDADASGSAGDAADLSAGADGGEGGRDGGAGAEDQ